MKILVVPIVMLSLMASIECLGSAEAKLNVVATLPDFGAIARSVGGEHVKVSTIARATEDPHFVDARPSFIRMLNQADILIEGGAELELGWLPQLVNNARNGKILADAPGHLILSRGVHLLEVPSGPIDRSQGDVHPSGNPHYWLDPANGKIIASEIAKTLSAVDPGHAAAYQANAQKFQERLDQKMAEWTKLMEPYRGTKVLEYHKSFEYLADRFGLQIAGQIEPKPGIEPSPAHLNALVPLARQQGVKLVIVEPFRSRRSPESVARAINAKLLLLPQSTGGHESIKDYFDLFDYDVGQIVEALRKVK
jgi:zinc/manganese transport system substrate-binding protein